MQNWLMPFLLQVSSNNTSRNVFNFFFGYHSFIIIINSWRSNYSHSQLLSTQNTTIKAAQWPISEGAPVVFVGVPKLVWPECHYVYQSTRLSAVLYVSKRYAPSRQLSILIVFIVRSRCMNPHICTGVLFHMLWQVAPEYVHAFSMTWFCISKQNLQFDRYL